MKILLTVFNQAPAVKYHQVTGRSQLVIFTLDVIILYDIMVPAQARQRLSYQICSIFCNHGISQIAVYNLDKQNHDFSAVNNLPVGPFEHNCSLFIIICPHYGNAIAGHAVLVNKTDGNCLLCTGRRQLQRINIPAV